MGFVYHGRVFDNDKAILQQITIYLQTVLTFYLNSDFLMSSHISSCNLIYLSAAVK